MRDNAPQPLATMRVPCQDLPGGTSHRRQHRVNKYIVLFGVYKGVEKGCSAKVVRARVRVVGTQTFIDPLSIV